MKKLLLLVGLLCPAYAWAGGGGAITETDKGSFLAQLLLIYTLAGLLVPLGKILKVENFVMEILVGIVLGATVLGRVWPEAHHWIFPDSGAQHVMLAAFAELGVGILLVKIGLELRPSEAMKHGKAAVSIGVIGVLIPMLMGSAASYAYLHYGGYPVPGNNSPIWVSLFIGNVMAISTIMVVERLIRANGLQRTSFAKIVVFGYAINDVCAWLFFGVIFQFATLSSGDGAIGKALLRLFGAGVITVAALRFIPIVVDALLVHASKQRKEEGVYIATFSMALLFGLVTHHLGVTLYYGAFLAGVVMSEAKVVTPDVKRGMTTFTEYLAMPVYFALIGLMVDLGGEFSLVWTVIFTVVGVGFRYLGALLGAKLSAVPKEEHRAIGVAFVPGGVAGLIFAGLALQYKLIDQKILGAIVISTLVSAVISGPWLKWAVKGMNRPTTKLGDAVVDLNSRILPRCDSQGGRSEALNQHILVRISAALAGQGDLASIPELRASLDDLKAHNQAEVGGESPGVDYPPSIAYLHFDRTRIERPLVFFFWSGNPTKWGHTEVRLIVVLVTPENEEDLAIRSKLS